MILFETDKKPLLFLLDLIENRALALPDFQRSFVWDPEATRELVVSVVRSFPAGTLLQMEGGAKVFAPRPFEEAPTLSSPPSHLVLDGQQRLTSLYQAFFGRGTHRFFLNVGELIDGRPVDDAVEVYTARRAGRYEAIEHQADALLLPLARLREFADWRDEVLDRLEGRIEDVKKLKKQLNEVEKRFVKPVELYQFPVTSLAASTPPEAVCAIFETLNRTGVKLSVFELLTARAFAHEVRLRDMWADAQARYPILTEFRVDPYYVLQTTALIARGNPQRSTVLSLEVDEITERWSEALEGLSGALRLLRDECGVLSQKWLPYGTMLITMAAAWSAISSAKGPAVGARRAKLGRWFWCSSFAQAYENSGNSVSERDAPQLEAWLEGGVAEPPVVADFAFNSARWYDITVRQRALYRATVALLMRRTPLDFHEGVPLTSQVVAGKDVDDHHVFPKAFLKRASLGSSADSVLNHTLIDRKTNIRIGGRAPSIYLREMAAELGGKLSQILDSHGLPSGAEGPLLADDFESFLRWRLRFLEQELAEVTGGAVGEGVEAVEEDGASDALGSDVASASPQDFIEFLDEFDPGQSRPLIEAFIEEVQSWPDVYVWIGRGSTPAWRLAHIARRGSRLGAFAKLHPRLARVGLRLRADDLPEESIANVLNRKGPYQVRVPLNSEEQLQHAIELARTAYERALL